jgi:hypothetical protein
MALLHLERIANGFSVYGQGLSLPDGAVSAGCHRPGAIRATTRVAPTVKSGLSSKRQHLYQVGGLRLRLIERVSLPISCEP